MYLIVFDESSVSQQESIFDEFGQFSDPDTFESWCDGMLWVFRFNAKLGVFEELYHQDHEHMNHIDPEQWGVGIDDFGRYWIPCGLYEPSDDDHVDTTKTSMSNSIARFIKNKSNPNEN